MTPMIWIAVLSFASGAHVNIPMDKDYGNRGECIAAVTELLKQFPDLPEPDGVECEHVPEHDGDDEDDDEPEKRGSEI